MRLVTNSSTYNCWTGGLSLCSPLELRWEDLNVAAGNLHDELQISTTPTIKQLIAGPKVWLWLNIKQQIMDSSLVQMPATETRSCLPPRKGFQT